MPLTAHTSARQRCCCTHLQSQQPPRHPPNTHQLPQLAGCAACKSDILVRCQQRPLHWQVCCCGLHAQLSTLQPSCRRHCTASARLALCTAHLSKVLLQCMVAVEGLLLLPLLPPQPCSPTLPCCVWAPPAPGWAAEGPWRWTCRAGSSTAAPP